jgi:hypothetical protein
MIIRSIKSGVYAAKSRYRKPVNIKFPLPESDFYADIENSRVSPVWSHSAGVHHIDSVYRVLVPVQFYFDESGIHAGSPALILAGYAAPTAQWLKFEDRWKTALAEAGVSCFHMSEFESRLSEFRGWSNPKRIAFLSGLIDIINETAVYGLCCAISMEDYREAVPEDLRQFDPRFAYLLCFHECLTWIPDILESVPPKETVNLVFDGNDQYTPMLYRAFCAFKQFFGEPRWLLGTLSYGSKRNYIPLQAADILAYEMYKHLSHRLTDQDRVMRKSLDRLDKGRYMLKRLTKESISRYSGAILSAFANEEPLQ